MERATGRCSLSGGRAHRLRSPAGRTLTRRRQRRVECRTGLGDTLLAKLAVRAYGRWEQPRFAPLVAPMLLSPAASVRREALNAMAQMQVPIDVLTLLPGERDASVRAVLFESIGRTPAVRPGTPATPPAPAVLDALLYGLRDESLIARTGAARGLESLLRRTARAHRPSPETVSTLRGALRDNRSAELRQLVLLSLTAAADRDSNTLADRFAHTSAQVRRLAVALSRQWVDDPSPMVRYQALRVAGTCERATAASAIPANTLFWSRSKCLVTASARRHH